MKTNPFGEYYARHSPDYRTFRPEYPPALFAYLASLCPTHDLAWDCGTGSGQAAVPLAKHFARVVATDASAAQLANADPHPRVEYLAAPARQVPLADATVDLVTVAQALHWFDLDPFYAEVRRVGRPHGLLAVWTYEFQSLGPDLAKVVAQVRAAVQPHWPPGREFVETGYRTIHFPFAELAVPRFEMTAEWDFPRVLGYIGTWSATKRFEMANGFNPLEPLAEEFAKTWGDPTVPRTVTWDFNVRVGRVNG